MRQLDTLEMEHVAGGAKPETGPNKWGHYNPKNPHSIGIGDPPGTPPGNSGGKPSGGGE